MPRINPLIFLPLKQKDGTNLKLILDIFSFFHSFNPGSSIDRSIEGRLAFIVRATVALTFSSLYLFLFPFSALILRIGELTRTMPAASSFAG